MRQRVNTLSRAPYACGVKAKRLLLWLQSKRSEPRTLIENRTNRESDTGLIGCLDQRILHLPTVGITPCPRTTPQIMKLATLGIAPCKKFDKTLRSHGLQQRWAEPLCHLIHPIAPGPEVVAHLKPLFRQSSERSLKSVSMGIHEAW
jgi:hypothetical protein